MHSINWLASVSEMERLLCGTNCMLKYNQVNFVLQKLNFEYDFHCEFLN